MKNRSHTARRSLWREKRLSYSFIYLNYHLFVDVSEQNPFNIGTAWMWTPACPMIITHHKMPQGDNAQFVIMWVKPHAHSFTQIFVHNTTII